VANLTMQVKCVSPTPIAMVTKICKYAQFTINLLWCKISPRFLHQTGWRTINFTVIQVSAHRPLLSW